MNANVFFYDYYELLTVAILSITAIVGLYQIRQLINQVKAAVESNSINRLNALLSLEDNIAERRLRLSEAGIKLVELGKAKATRELHPGEFDTAELRYNEAKQMYLNGLDRLCYCLDRGLLNEDELRSEYRDVINAAIKDFKTDFQTGTPYRNIKKIYERWAET
ncbi:MAG: hypothetical protein WBV23_10475 [Desulfobaccales bacterium]